MIKIKFKRDKCKFLNWLWEKKIEEMLLKICVYIIVFIGSSMARRHHLVVRVSNFLSIDFLAHTGKKKQNAAYIMCRLQTIVFGKYIRIGEFWEDWWPEDEYQQMFSENHKWRIIHSYDKRLSRICWFQLACDPLIIECMRKQHLYVCGSAFKVIRNYHESYLIERVKTIDGRRSNKWTFYFFSHRMTFDDILHWARLVSIRVAYLMWSCTISKSIQIEKMKLYVPIIYSEYHLYNISDQLFSCILPQFGLTLDKTMSDAMNPFLDEHQGIEMNNLTKL